MEGEECHQQCKAQKAAARKARKANQAQRESELKNKLDFYVPADQFKKMSLEEKKKLFEKRKILAYSAFSTHESPLVAASSNV